jgi:hypothetical protein
MNASSLLGCPCNPLRTPLIKNERNSPTAASRSALSAARRFIQSLSVVFIGFVAGFIPSSRKVVSRGKMKPGHSIGGTERSTELPVSSSLDHLAYFLTRSGQFFSALAMFPSKSLLNCTRIAGLRLR